MNYRFFSTSAAALTTVLTTVLTIVLTTVLTIVQTTVQHHSRREVHASEAIPGLSTSNTPCPKGDAESKFKRTSRIRTQDSSVMFRLCKSQAPNAECSTESNKNVTLSYQSIDICSN